MSLTEFILLILTQLSMLALADWCARSKRRADDPYLDVPVDERGDV